MRRLSESRSFGVDMAWHPGRRLAPGSTSLFLIPLSVGLTPSGREQQPHHGHQHTRFCLQPCQLFASTLPTPLSRRLGRPLGHGSDRADSMERLQVVPELRPRRRPIQPPWLVADHTATPDRYQHGGRQEIHEGPRSEDLVQRGLAGQTKKRCKAKCWAASNPPEAARPARSRSVSKCS